MALYHPRLEKIDPVDYTSIANDRTLVPHNRTYLTDDRCVLMVNTLFFEVDCTGIAGRSQLFSRDTDATEMHVSPSLCRFHLKK